MGRARAEAEHKRQLELERRRQVQEARKKLFSASALASLSKRDKPPPSSPGHGLKFSFDPDAEPAPESLLPPSSSSKPAKSLTEFVNAWEIAVDEAIGMVDRIHDEDDDGDDEQGANNQAYIDEIKNEMYGQTDFASKGRWQTAAHRPAVGALLPVVPDQTTKPWQSGA
jgi:hypothetical protein